MRSPTETLDSIAKAEKITRRIAAHDSFFTDHYRGCAGECSGICKDLSPRCSKARATAAAHLTDPTSITWEAYSGIDFVGILRLSRIIKGSDAYAHYFFFDSKLKDKEPILEAWQEWGFSDHGSFWPALHRVTVEIPAYASALARHAQKYLGFGGPYEYRTDRGTKLFVEGVRERALAKDGTLWDQLIMGKHREP